MLCRVCVLVDPSCDSTTYFLSMIASCLVMLRKRGLKGFFGSSLTNKLLTYFGRNVGIEIRACVGSLLNVQRVTTPKTYLRLPMIVARNLNHAFQHFVDRFRKQFDSCSLCLLSIRGKEVFIKAIIQAIPIYSMQCFLFPLKFCCNLSMIVFGKIGWGMYFRDFASYNFALLVKQG